MHPFVLLNSKGPKDRWGCPPSTPKPPTHCFLFGSFAPGSGLHSWSSWGKSRAPHCGLASDLCHQTAWFCYQDKLTVSQTDLPPDMFPLGGTGSSKRAKTPVCRISTEVAPATKFWGWQGSPVCLCRDEGRSRRQSQMPMWSNREEESWKETEN